MGIRDISGLGPAVRLLLAVWVALLAATTGRANELTYSLGELTTRHGQLELRLELQAEAFLAGMNLDGLINTNQSPQEAEYDRLRALPPDVLTPEVQAFFHNWSKLMLIEVGREAMVLDVAEVSVPEIGDPDRPRITTIILTGALPPAASEIVLTWPAGSGELSLRQIGVREGWTGMLQGGQSTEPIPLYGARANVSLRIVQQFIPMGFAHILPYGVDHVLFVLGLFFFSARFRILVLQVSTFTVAHSLTLVLASWTDLNLRPSLIEMMIALSIVLIAAENILAKTFPPWRLAVVFGFGLMHGLGFASVLQEMDLPQATFIPALLGFNLGVELGQLTVIAFALLTFGLRFRDRPWYHDRIEVPASAAIGLIALLWLLTMAGLF